MNKTITIIIIIALAFIGGYFLLKETAQAPVLETINQQQNLPTQSGLPVQAGETQPINTPIESIVIQSVKNEVIYTNSGYSPKEINIKVGETVTWENESSYGLWTASAIHPTHVIYSGTSLDEHCPDVQNTSFDECKSSQPGESWSFKFDKKGIWRYHNHLQSSDFGSIVVE